MQNNAQLNNAHLSKPSATLEEHDPAKHRDDWQNGGDGGYTDGSQRWGNASGGSTENNSVGCEFLGDISDISSIQKQWNDDE